MKSNNFKCKICQRMFYKSFTFKQHWLTIHCKESSCFKESKWKEMYECVENKMDKNDERMCTNSYQERNTSGKKLYTCNVCQKTFSRSCNLIQHMSCGHAKEHGVSMDEKLTSKPKKTNNLQEGNVSGKQLHTCNVCQKKFIQACHLKQHMWSAHLQRGGTFVDKELIGESKCVESKHIESKKEKRMKRLRCKLCQKMFINGIYFKQHWLTWHSQNDDPSECSNLEDMWELVELEIKSIPSILASGGENEETNPQGVRKFKCKTCQQNLCDNLNKFKRHWLAKHSKEQVPSDKGKWKELYEVVRVKVVADDAGKTAIRCKICEKIIYGHLYEFRRHWFAKHSGGNVPSDISQWKELYQLVKVEVIESQVSEEVTRKVIPKTKCKCKICEQTLCRIDRFKRHWLRFHAQESDPLHKWSTMYELVDASESGNGDYDGVKKVRCKNCKKILSLHNFQPHWFAKHSDGNVPSDYSEWKELYEFVKVEDVVDNTATNQNIGNKVIFKRTKKDGKKVQVDETCENEVEESTEIQDAAEKIHRRKQRQCKSLKRPYSVQYSGESNHSVDKERMCGLVELETEGNSPNVPNQPKSEPQQQQQRRQRPQQRQQQRQNKKVAEEVKLKNNMKFKRCNRCLKVFSRGFNFRRHWVACHSEGNVSSKDIKWEKLFQVVEVEVEVNSHDAENKKVKRAAKKRKAKSVKNIKCKVCQKILSDRSSNFKRHYLSFRSQECNCSESNSWQKMFEDVEEEAFQSENQGISPRTKAKCKSCQTILNGCVSDFKQHWLRNHSKKYDLSQGGKWKEMYEFVEEDLQQELMNGEIEAVGGLTETRDVYKRPRCICKECYKGFNSLSNFKRHWLTIHSTKNCADKESRWRVMYKNVARDVDDFQKDPSHNPGTSKSRRQKRLQCNACSKQFSKRLNLKRHISSAHRDEIVSPPGVSNMEMKSEYNWKPQRTSGEFESTDRHPEISKEREECVGDEANSRCDGIERNICFLDENRSGRYLDEARRSETIKVKEECQCGEEEDTVLDAIEENILLPKESGCLEDGASQFSDVFEDSCLPEVCRVKVKCEYGEKETSHEFEEMTYICPQCGKLFNSATDLIQHDVDDH